MMSDDVKNIRENVEFKTFWTTGKPEEHVSFKLGMYEMSRIKYDSGYELQSRFLIGTSAAPLEEIFPPEGPGWDMISNAELPTDCLMKILDETDRTSSKPKISGWHLTYFNDNLGSETGVDRGNDAPDFKEVRTFWKQRCTNKPAAFTGKLGEHPDAPYYFQKESRVVYHALLNGGCINSDVPYMKYTYEGLDVYTIFGYHDPYWLPNVDEVLSFSIPSDGGYEQDMSFHITTESDRDDIIKRRVELSNHVKWGLDYASSIRLYEGEHGVELGRFPEFSEFESEYASKTLPEFRVYNKEKGFVPYNSFDECWQNSEKIAELRCASGSSYTTTYWGNVYPSWPRYTGIMTIIYTFDKNESVYLSDANGKYENKVANSPSEHIDDLNLEQYFRELQSGLRLATDLNFKTLFYDSPVGFYSCPEIGLKKPPGPRSDWPEKWENVPEHKFTDDASDDAEIFNFDYYGNLVKISSSMLSLSADGFLRYNLSEKKSLSGNSYVCKLDELVDEITMHSFYYAQPKTLVQTRVGRFIKNLTKHNHMSPAFELVGMVFLLCIENSNKSDKIKNSWKSFWEERKKQRDYRDFKFLQ